MSDRQRSPVQIRAGSFIKKMKKNKFTLWDERYEKGQHWESKKTSKDIKDFEKYLKKRTKILDLGCGSGRDAIYLAKKGFEVYGIDVSKVALERARKKYGGKNLHLIVGEAENLPFKNNFFDAIYCGWVLHFTKLEKSTSEIIRVLKKGGVVYLGFLLNMKFIETGKIENIIEKGKTMPYFKKLKIIKEKEYEVTDADEERPHKHDISVVVLKK